MTAALAALSLALVASACAGNRAPNRPLSTSPTGGASATAQVPAPREAYATSRNTRGLRPGAELPRAAGETPAARK